jgi:hypothetical protein
MNVAASAAAIAAALLCFTAVGQAQTAGIGASARVLRVITVAGARTLAFGNVLPGVARTVGVAAGTSGRFTLRGQNGANVNLRFTLPSNLTNGASTLPIGSWTGYVNTVNNTGGAGRAFTPSAAATAATFSASGRLFVFIGGTVTPAANQAAGSYTGTVTLTAAYF